ncbi:thioesterase family protein [Qipengyuania gaetbuli]|nr:acyl-CoA thioesterase domain-containing protein [Qipengyuania gaetbuli]MBY6015889.1 thioesterase family protein [Qipengyuania gaetbuli]
MSIARFPFWRVVPGERNGEYILPVTRPATVGPEGTPHVMGGASLAAAVDVLQLESEQPLLWAQVQFLAPTQHAEELVITCEQYGGGQSVGQWFAEIRSNGRLVQRINAALGAREPSEQRIFAVMPDVPGPDACEGKPPDHNGFDDNLVGSWSGGPPWKIPNAGTKRCGAARKRASRSMRAGWRWCRTSSSVRIPRPAADPVSMICFALFKAPSRAGFSALRNSPPSTAAL